MQQSLDLNLDLLVGEIGLLLQFRSQCSSEFIRLAGQQLGQGWNDAAHVALSDQSCGPRAEEATTQT